jgi:L,D-peptidoglycan transpeptidase YkuD (ErfK/YbiS/YcfS/YnhG family)
MLSDDGKKTAIGDHLAIHSNGTEGCFAVHTASLARLAPTTRT